MTQACLTYLYLIRLREQRTLIDPTEDEQEILADHFDYLKSAAGQGKVLLAGPCTDAAFGITIFTATSTEEANTFMNNDPAVKEGIMTAELHPFRISLLSESVKDVAREVLAQP